jgi:hypothetical protein
LRPLLPGAILCAGLLAGCGSAPVVHELREAPAGVNEGEAIGFLLSSFGHQSGEGRALKEQAVDGPRLEQFFEDCMRQEIAERHPGLRFVRCRES